MPASVGIREIGLLPVENVDSVVSRVSLVEIYSL